MTNNSTEMQKEELLAARETEENRCFGGIEGEHSVETESTAITHEIIQLGKGQVSITKHGHEE